MPAAHSDPPEVCLIGYGEVGRIIAGALRALGRIPARMASATEVLQAAVAEAGCDMAMDRDVADWRGFAGRLPAVTPTRWNLLLQEER